MAAVSISLEQAFDQCRWQRRTRKQHTRAKQPCPMHQAGQCRQVTKVKVIGLVEYQIATEQSQHGRNLPPALAVLLWLV